MRIYVWKKVVRKKLHYQIVIHQKSKKIKIVTYSIVRTEYLINKTKNKPQKGFDIK